MHASVIPIVQSGVRLDAWTWEPGIVMPLLASGMLYARGAVALRARKPRRGVRLWEIAAFHAGLIVLALALLSPLHAASEQLFSAHMIQHELMMAVAAPLLVVGKPMIVMLWAIPVRARRALGHASQSVIWRRSWQLLSRPFDAWLIHALVIWGWHVPTLFQATLHSDMVHALQHASFLGSALLFWWAIIHPRHRASLGLSVIYLFTTAVHTTALGALMAVARVPWYPEYANGAAAWGLSPLEDQQLAGLIMWIPAGLVYLVAALLIVRRWLRDSDWRVEYSERAAATI
jgi:putative membrane protein